MSAYFGNVGNNANNNAGLYNLTNQFNSLSINVQGSNANNIQAPESPRTPVHQRANNAFNRMIEERKEQAFESPVETQRPQVPPNAPPRPRLYAQGHDAQGHGNAQPRRLNLENIPRVNRAGHIGGQLFSNSQCTSMELD